MTLRTTIRNRGTDSCEVILSGRLDADTVKACSQNLAELPARGMRLLLLDMADLSFISSLGLRLLLNLRKQVEAAGGVVVMTRLQPQIAKVLEIAQILPKVSIFESVEEADRYFAAMQQKVLDEQKNP